MKVIICITLAYNDSYTPDAVSCALPCGAARVHVVVRHRIRCEWTLRSIHRDGDADAVLVRIVVWYGRREWMEPTGWVSVSGATWRVSGRTRFHDDDDS